MDEYVQYHNPEYADFPVEKPGKFSIYTSKGTDGLLGARVWLVARKRDTREYYLVYWFIVDAVVVGTGTDKNSVVGDEGAWLRPAVRIDHLNWFGSFRTYLGNFGLGLQRIVDHGLAEKLRAAANVATLSSRIGSEGVETGEDTSEDPKPLSDQINAEVFVEALTNVRPRMSNDHLVMLRAHSFSDDHVITATELAAAAGFGDHRVANAQYGRLGALLRSSSPILQSVAGQQSHVIASFLAPDDQHPHWRWQMHPGLVQALDELGWFEDDDPVEPSELQSSSANEGQMRRRQVWHRHREQRLRLAKLEQARKAHPEGRVACQVPGCGFDFESVYGVLGDGYAEVHHIVPLSDLEPGSLTTLDDLVVVCSNCHRMIHRGGECRAVNSLIQRRGPGGLTNA